MIDEVRTLLLNPAGVAGYRRVADAPADRVMALFGVLTPDDAAAVDRLMPLALAPDLRGLRRFFDGRTTSMPTGSVYRDSCLPDVPDGLYDTVFGGGWWAVAALFDAADPVTAGELREFSAAVESADSAYAIGAVLLACAYRRRMLQEGGSL